MFPLEGNIPSFFSWSATQKIVCLCVWMLDLQTQYLFIPSKKNLETNENYESLVRRYILQNLRMLILFTDLSRNYLHLQKICNINFLFLKHDTKFSEGICFFHFHTSYFVKNCHLIHLMKHRIPHNLNIWILDFLIDNFINKTWFWNLFVNGNK